jgi:tetratricopeptide (TPR) repeat protein
LLKKKPVQRAKPRAPVGKRRKGPASPRPKAAAPSKSKLPARTKAVLPAGPPRRAVPPPPPAVPDKQQQAYDDAVRLFYAHRWDRADALFQKVMAGPDRTLAHHAQMHSQMCQKQIRPPEVKLKTAEDHYNYAVTMMNARRLPEAAEHLEAALRIAPQVDYIHYALAATEALRGNAQAAYERLKTAISLQPRNRPQARSDADFAGVRDYPPLASLLQLDRGVPSQ